MLPNAGFLPSAMSAVHSGLEDRFCSVQMPYPVLFRTGTVKRFSDRSLVLHKDFKPHTIPEIRNLVRCNQLCRRVKLTADCSLGILKPQDFAHKTISVRKLGVVYI